MTKVSHLITNIIIAIAFFGCASQADLETLNKKSTVGSAYKDASELFEVIQESGFVCQKILEIQEASLTGFSTMKSCIYSQPEKELQSVDSLVLNPDIANILVMQTAMEGFRNSEEKTGKKLFFLVGPNWILYSKEINPLLIIQEKIGGKLQ